MRERLGGADRDRRRRESRRRTRDGDRERIPRREWDAERADRRVDPQADPRLRDHGIGASPDAGEQELTGIQRQESRVDRLDRTVGRDHAGVADRGHVRQVGLVIERGLGAHDPRPAPVVISPGGDGAESPIGHGQGIDTGRDGEKQDRDGEHVSAHGSGGGEGREHQDIYPVEAGNCHAVSYGSPGRARPRSGTGFPQPPRRSSWTDRDRDSPAAPRGG